MYVVTFAQTYKVYTRIKLVFNSKEGFHGRGTDVTVQAN